MTSPRSLLAGTLAFFGLIVVVVLADGIGRQLGAALAGLLP